VGRDIGKVNEEVELLEVLTHFSDSQILFATTFYALEPHG